MKSGSRKIQALLSWLGVQRAVFELATLESSGQATQEESAELRARLAESEARLAERTALLYNLQQHYSSEHFDLQKCMRDLKTEEMRNAGAYASLETTMDRARGLQRRIDKLKERLRRYEVVEDEHFDSAPIRVEQPRPETGA